MPRNGSGSYDLPVNAWNPAINGVSATPADWQALINDVATAIQGSVASDGQTPMTGDLAMGGYRLTGAGAPVGMGDALRFQQMQKGSNIASAATITIPFEGNLFEVTGTTGITTINDTFPGRVVWLYFQDAVTLTNSDNLVLPDGMDATTAAGDMLCAINTGTGIWAVVAWSRANASTGGIVGQSRNLTMSISSASATATVTADEIIVESALGGARYCLANFSESINLTTTGAGGMDTGSAPASGYVALYVIYNPNAATSALLATNATSAAAAEIYGGANMPSGYTASALVGVWPTNSSSQFIVGYLIDRYFSMKNVLALSTTANGNHTAFSVAGAVPLNAKTATGTLGYSNTANAAMGLTVFGSSLGVGTAGTSSNIAAGEAKSWPFSNLPIIDGQTLYYSTNNNAGVSTYNVSISGYTF